MEKKKSWLSLFLFDGVLLFFLLAAFFYLYLLREAGAPFACAFYEHFHLYCPGCGMTRAAEALFRGDVWLSLCCHPAFLLGCFTLLYYQTGLLFALKKPYRVKAWPAVAFAAFLVGFFFLRNALFLLFNVDFLGDLSSYGGII